MNDADYIRGASSIVASNAKIADSNTLAGKSFAEVETAEARATKTVIAQAAAMNRAAAVSRSRIAVLQGGPVAGLSGAQQTSLLAAEQKKLARATGETSIATRDFSSATRMADRDLSKTIRGGLAGSGVFSGLGRSLAFASGGFLAVAGSATLVSRSITGAEALAKAQESLGVAIEHTGGNLAKLLPRYRATAQAAQQFGVDQADATTGHRSHGQRR
jgi:hypothetical protein